MLETRADHPIHQYRKDNNLTLEAFGALVDAQKSAVSKWERGLPPSPQTARRIEEATGIPRWKLRPDLWEPPSHDLAQAEASA